MYGLKAGGVGVTSLSSFDHDILFLLPQECACHLRFACYGVQVRSQENSADLQLPVCDGEQGKASGSCLIPSLSAPVHCAKWVETFRLRASRPKGTRSWVWRRSAMDTDSSCPFHVMPGQCKPCPIIIIFGQ